MNSAPAAPLFDTPLTRDAGIELPILCGAMYPCSNPELVAAASEAGAMGIIQPLSMVFVHRHDFKAGLALIRSLTAKPVGMNVIVERSVKAYERRMQGWVDDALEAGVRFFVTSLGNPRWVVERAAQVGGVVYHDVTDRRWAEKGLEAGARGLICVNDRAGGHAGRMTSAQLMTELKDLGVPLVCAGGIGAPAGFHDALKSGYAGIQMGTRFIATTECSAHGDYKAALVRATASDITLTERISGVPVAIIRTPTIERIGTRAGPLARLMLRNARTKNWMRTIYAVQSLWKLGKASTRGASYSDYWQAGKSVDDVEAVVSVKDLLARFRTP